MGLSKDSMGLKAVDCGLVIKKENPQDNVIALAGNPNVGKSTVFNGLTGLKQHTGNWPGKTVTNAQGYCHYKGRGYIMVDLPGCYSLMAHSAEEEVARDFICYGCADCTVVVCDATSLERNLNLVLQTIEITPNVVVCVNLLDEAKRKRINVNLQSLSKRLGVPVVGTSARKKNGAYAIMPAVKKATEEKNNVKTVNVKYPPYIETAIKRLTPHLSEICSDRLNERWLALRLLENDVSQIKAIETFLNADIVNDIKISEELKAINAIFTDQKITPEKLKDSIITAIIHKAEEIAKSAVATHKNGTERDRKIDKIVTGKYTAFPIMFATLLVIFWITITGANYPSDLISTGLFWVEEWLIEFFVFIGAPKVVYELLVYGVYRVTAWVVSVMLPPMAIFFPLFTLLEDLGFLPRVAFNLDKCFKRCCACGKQALTMCMGFGCNAAGIVGCRIIDSPRERLIAIITNNFVPCNGRFPTLIAIITMFFLGSVAGVYQSFFSAFFLALIIVLGIVTTLFISKLLSKTILKGIPSSFTLELPPYRTPQVGRVIVRSIFDRTLFVLGRAVCAAAPAGFVIWLMANIYVGDVSVLNLCAGFLDPFAYYLGMDGVILLAFILGFPANEIVVPIIIMAYMSMGMITDYSSLNQLKDLLLANNWTWITAVSVMLFSLMHWPCSTTCLTIKKETNSLKWTAISVLVPTITGFAICFIFTTIARLFC